MGSTANPLRKVLREHSKSQANILAVRLVPSTPPHSLEEQSLRDEIYGRPPLPTDASHILRPISGDSHNQPLALQRSESVSSEQHLYPPKSQTTLGSSVTAHQSTQPREQVSREKWRPLPKTGKHVAVNPDKKTFRVLDELQTRSEGLTSPPSLASSASHSQPLYSHPVDGPTRSQSSCAPESTAISTPASASPTIGEDQITGSPWNYKLVGGLRKVPKTPDLKQKAVADSPIPPVPAPSDDSKPVPGLSTKLSFRSTGTASTTSENTNYKVYGISPSQSCQEIPSSSDSNHHLHGQLYPRQNVENIIPPSSSGSNYQVLGHSSPAPSEIDFDSENYQLHDDPLPSVSYSSQIRNEYSCESLIVPPLRPKPKHSVERLGYYKSQPRESPRTGSITSISTVLSQEAAQAIVASGSVIYLPSSKYPSASSSWALSAQASPARSHMQEHPHQWSSQLSTVPSESEAGTDGGSRSWSDGNGRRSSGFPSIHSRQLPSISSSLHQEEHLRSASLEPPQPVLIRSGRREVAGSIIRVIDQDEDRDGLSPIPDLRQRPSRTRLSDFFSITPDNGRTNTMRSTSSSRANSLLASSIPAWARLYYGSGERRYLGAPGSSTEGTDSRPQSSFRSGSPDMSNLPLSIYSLRRRPRDGQPLEAPRRAGSIEISPLPLLGPDGAPIYNSFQRRSRPSSSILSPHLRRDKRTTRSRGSTFFLEPASVDWTQGDGVLSSKRKIQIIMFIVGFIFPFTWMIASFLPLPPSPIFLTSERQSQSNLDISSNTNSMDRRFGPIDEARYESTKWWRNLNRGMSVVGVFIIVAIITLAVVGVKQRWG